LEGLRDRQRQHADAFIDERFGLFARRLAADIALFRFAVVDAARLLREALAMTWRTICSHWACMPGSWVAMTSRFGSAAPKFRRGALGSLATVVSPQR